MLTQLSGTASHTSLLSSQLTRVSNGLLNNEKIKGFYYSGSQGGASSPTNSSNSGASSSDFTGLRPHTLPVPDASAMLEEVVSRQSPSSTKDRETYLKKVTHYGVTPLVPWEEVATELAKLANSITTQNPLGEAPRESNYYQKDSSTPLTHDPDLIIVPSEEIKPSIDLHGTIYAASSSPKIYPTSGEVAVLPKQEEDVTLSASYQSAQSAPQAKSYTGIEESVVDKKYATYPQPKKEIIRTQFFPSISSQFPNPAELAIGGNAIRATTPSQESLEQEIALIKTEALKRRNETSTEQHTSPDTKVQKQQVLQNLITGSNLAINPKSPKVVKTGEENMAAFRKIKESLKKALNGGQLGSDGAPLAKSTVSQPVTAEFGYDNKENKAPRQQSSAIRAGGNTSLINPELVSSRQGLNGTQSSSRHFPEAKVFKVSSQPLNTGDKSGSHSQATPSQPQNTFASQNQTPGPDVPAIMPQENPVVGSQSPTSPQPAPEMVMSGSQVRQPVASVVAPQEIHYALLAPHQPATENDNGVKPQAPALPQPTSSQFATTKDVARKYLQIKHTSSQPDNAIAGNGNGAEPQGPKSPQPFLQEPSLLASGDATPSQNATSSGVEQQIASHQLVSNVDLSTTPTHKKTPKLIVRHQREEPNATPPSPENPGKNSYCSTFLSSAYNSFVATYTAFRNAFTFSKKSAGTETENGEAKPSTSMTARFWEALASMVPSRFKSNSNSGTTETDPLLPKNKESKSSVGRS